MVVIMAIGIGGGQIPVLIKRHPGIKAPALAALAYTPPFGAAAAMTGAAAAAGLFVILCWLAALVAALVALERRPPQRQRLETTALSFDSRFDRVAAWLGADDAPLVGHWLRFYLRNTRFRTFMLISLPLVGFLTYNFGRQKAGFGDVFVSALGTFGIVSFGSTRFIVNQFGYSGGGFRRFFLLPAPPRAALRAGSRASLLLAAPMIPLAALGWVLLAPVPFDARKVFMLVCSGVAGLFLFHAFGLWTTIYGPRKANYYSNLGNDLSLLGNLVVIGGVVSCLLLPHAVHALSPRLVSPDYWWWMLAPVVCALLFYRISLDAAGGLLEARREQLMAVVEGRE
jgi:hypothetical protein